MDDLEQAHDALAVLLTYPVAPLADRVAGRIEAVLRVVPAAAPDLAPFRAWVEGVSPETVEEHYARTFDHSAKRALEVGWHVYGETYDRGAFLVRMRDLLRRSGVGENGELPDHLTHVLMVLGRSDDAVAAELGSLAVRAIAAVAAELAKDRNPYAGVLDAAWKLVAARAPEEVPG